MKELQLSQDLNVITAEINSYKQVAGHSFIEIGRRLLHVNENNLAYGDWNPFLESIQMSNSQARRFMTIAKEYDMGKLPNVGQIGFTAMYEIATLPEEKRTEAINEDGSVKTVQEIRDLKKQNKELEQAKQQAESQAKQARESEQIAIKKLEQEQAREMQVIEREIVKEVIPEETKNEIEHLKEMARLSEQSYKEAQKELESHRLINTNEFDEEKAEKELRKLKFEAEKGVLRLTVKVNKFLEEIAVYGYMEGEIATSSKSTKEQLKGSLEHLDNFINKMEVVLKGRIEI